jgi:hypothetical protein
VQPESTQGEDGKQEETKPQVRERAQLDRRAQIGFDICCLINRRILEREGYQMEGAARRGKPPTSRRL